MAVYGVFESDSYIYFYQRNPVNIEYFVEGVFYRTQRSGMHTPGSEYSLTIWVSILVAQLEYIQGFLISSAMSTRTSGKND